MKKYIYWLIPIILFLLQLNMTLHSFNQIRFEELIESVQGPLYMSRHMVIAGNHTNIGWYAFLLFIYKIFGFTLNTPKIALLVFSCISFLATAILLKRYFSPVYAAVILITIGLSPTVMFFTTQNLHLGVGLQMVPVFILLLTSINFQKKAQSVVLEIIIFSLAMWVLLFYPPFMFFVLGIWLFFLKKLYNHYNRYNYYNSYSILVAIFAFLLPLIIGFVFIQNKNILVYDQNTGTGILRGGGTLSFSADSFAKAWSGVIHDFFIQAVSYHYEPNTVEFSNGYPIITIITVMTIITVILRREKRLKSYVWILFIIILSNMLIISITSDIAIPGMKRATPLLGCIYMLWVLAWYYVSHPVIPSPLINTQDEGSSKQIAAGSLNPRNDKFKIIVIGLLSLLTIHNVFVYPVNLSHISDASPFADVQWFAVRGDPQKSLDMYVSQVQKKDITIDCKEFLTRYTTCEYQFIKAAIESSCTFNNLQCHKVILAPQE